MLDTEAVYLTTGEVSVLLFCEKAIQKSDFTFCSPQWLQGSPQGSSFLIRGTTRAMWWVSCPQSMGWSPWDAWHRVSRGLAVSTQVLTAGLSPINCCDPG